MVRPIRRSSNKNPPIFSHEFVIQNHADIVACVMLVIVIGLMVQVTSPLASIFVSIQYNQTQTADNVVFYKSGVLDWAAVFFYSLVCIIMHAILQEYALDKISKKLHLSKSKLAIFSNSCQLSVFYLISIVWGVDVIIKEHFIPDVSKLWTDYPASMSFLLKYFLIIQMSYSLHEIPELYFQRTKPEEYTEKGLRSLVSLVLIAVPYFLNFNRLLVCLVVLHQVSDLVHHISLLIQTVDKDEKFTKATRILSNIFMVLSRLGSIVLAVLTLWYGLALGTPKEFSYETGYFNTAPVRLALLGGILILQVYLTFTAISQELARSQDSRTYIPVPKVKQPKKEKPKKSKRLEESDLPEVDQNTNKTLRNRAAKVK